MRALQQFVSLTSIFVSVTFLGLSTEASRVCAAGVCVSATAGGVCVSATAAGVCVSATAGCKSNKSTAAMFTSFKAINVSAADVRESFTANCEAALDCSASAEAG